MFSIAVIGNGIAGLAAVRALQYAGHAPLLISPARGRSGNRGELLGSLARASLTRLGWDILLDDERIAMPAEARFSAWGSPWLRRVAVDPQTGAGWHIDRARLESAMRESTRTLPMSHVTASVRGCDRQGDTWRLSLSTGEQMHARFLIDCSGRAATIARRLGGQRSRNSHLIAIHRTFSIPDSTIMAATMVESAPDGWWYTSPTPSLDQLFAAWFTDADMLPDRDISRHDLWSSRLETAPNTQARLASLGITVPEAPAKTVVAATTRQERVAGDGWAAAGDAAAALDPLAGHGLTVALWSAIRAASAAHAWLHGDTSALRDYQEAVTVGMTRFTADADRHYRAERRFEGREFWARRHQQDRGPSDVRTNVRARISASPA